MWKANKPSYILDTLISLRMDLLRKLYTTYAPTGREWPMIQFVLDYLKEHVPQAQVEMDDWGNLYIRRSRSLKVNVERLKVNDQSADEASLNINSSEDGFPTLCCHLDQAQKTRSEDFEVKSRSASEGEDELYGWSESRNAPEGLGADDKNGIWVCLKALELCEHLKVFMSVGEEKGCWGSNRADMSFFSDALYILEPDCKGGEEIRTLLKGVPCASPEFEAALNAEKFGYTITEGKTTDILPLTLSGIGVSCANIPCGYYNPHKDEEYCNIAELQKCLDFVLHTLQTLRTRYPHTFTTPTQEWVKSQVNSNS